MRSRSAAEREGRPVVQADRDTAGGEETPSATGLRRPSVLAWLRMVRFSKRTEHAANEHLRDWGLSLGQFDVLATVGAAEGLMQQELADRLVVTKGNVCQLLDRLEREGVVERRQEGRANRLWLTDRGRALYREVVPAHEDLIARRFAPLSREEQRQLHALLAKLDRGGCAHDLLGTVEDESIEPPRITHGWTPSRQDRPSCLSAGLDSRPSL